MWFLKGEMNKILEAKNKCKNIAAILLPKIQIHTFQLFFSHLDIIIAIEKQYVYFVRFYYVQMMIIRYYGMAFEGLQIYLFKIAMSASSYICLLKVLLHQKETNNFLLWRRELKKGQCSFSLTGDGVCTKNAVDNSWLVFWTDGDGLVARIRPQEFSF